MTAASIVVLYALGGSWFALEMAERPTPRNHSDGLPMLVCFVFWPILLAGVAVARWQERRAKAERRRRPA